jgi:hypothetical protein
MRSLYLARMRSASALRFANSCSSLNLDRMMTVVGTFSGVSSSPVSRCFLCSLTRGRVVVQVARFLGGERSVLRVRSAVIDGW